jgi:hypothetical protein
MYYLLILMFVNICFADIHLSGVAKIRPRWDSVENHTDTTKSGDYYYLYQARLHLKADIGEGWYFSTKLGHNGIAYWAGKFSEGELPNSEALSIAGRSSLSFMELYYGLSREKYGFALGLVPINGIGNPVLDIHYYPRNMTEIPWLILNNNAYHGFSSFLKLGGGKLNARLSVDNNVKQSSEYNGMKTKSSDQNTVMLSYDYSNTSGMSASPWLIKTFGGDTLGNPLTLGANLTLSIIRGFTLFTSYYITSQSQEGTDTYSGNLLRVGLKGKIGPGTLVGWFDKTGYNPEDGNTANGSFVWIHYQYTLFKSEAGQVILKPTVRLLRKSENNQSTFSRSKFELTTVMKFQ